MGAKVRKLIDDHVISLGVDPKIPPIQLNDAEFDTHLARAANDRAKAADDFDARMGAEAVYELLKTIDLAQEEIRLREEIQSTNSETKLKRLSKRIKLVGFRHLMDEAALRQDA